MKKTKYSSKEEWLFARRGKITGSRLKDVILKRGTEPKLGYYELIAERLAIAPDDENAMQRGARLESEAIEKFSKLIKKEVNTDLEIWEREDNKSIAISPDGYIGDKIAVEVKCLSSALHIKGLLTQKVPDDYEFQVLQYFIVNDKLKKLYFVFYDPRVIGKELFYLTIERKNLEEDIKQYLEYQNKILLEVDEIVNSLTY